MEFEVYFSKYLEGTKAMQTNNNATVELERYFYRLYLFILINFRTHVINSFWMELLSFQSMMAVNLKTFLSGELMSLSKLLRIDFSLLHSESEDKIQLGTRVLTASTDDHSILAFLKTKTVDRTRLHWGLEPNRFGQITNNKSQIVYYDLPEIEITVNDMIFGVEKGKCSKEVNYLTSDSYICGRNVTQSKCTSATPKNCTFQNKTIEGGYTDVETYIDGESTYLDIFTNEKVYKLDPWSFPVDDNGHLIIKLEPAIIISSDTKQRIWPGKDVVFPHIIFPEVINLSYLFYVYLGAVKTTSHLV
jgi:hypothetical protein